jgi:hypothetical protein
MKEKLIIEKLEELLLKSNEITTFYGKIIDQNATFLHVHGIKASKEDIEFSQKLRYEFDTLKGEYRKLLQALESSPDTELFESKEDEIMYLNMQYYMEYCSTHEYITPQEWRNTKKHF